MGFTNQWYRMGVATAQTLSLPSGVPIHVLRAPEFIATKLEAFYGRGGGDYLFSHDMGDIISVIDGRASLLNECHESLAPLRVYLATQFKHLLTKRSFIDGLQGHMPPDGASQARLPDLLIKIQHISELPIT